MPLTWVWVDCARIASEQTCCSPTIRGTAWEWLRHWDIGTLRQQLIVCAFNRVFALIGFKSVKDTHRQSVRHRRRIALNVAVRHSTQSSTLTAVDCTQVCSEVKSKKVLVSDWIERLLFEQKPIHCIEQFHRKSFASLSVPQCLASIGAHITRDDPNQQSRRLKSKNFRWVSVLISKLFVHQNFAPNISLIVFDFICRPFER